MRLLCFIFLFSLVLSDILEEDNVLILTTNNFDTALDIHHHILVEFYAPWCGHCQALAPEYSKAATKLMEMDSDVRLAKVDATIEKELAQSRSVKGYPTLIFYKNGSPIDYNGPRKADGIIQWLERKTTSPLTIIDTKEKLLPFTETDKISIVGYFLSENSSMVFLDVASKMDRFTFGLVTNVELFDTFLSGEQGIIVYKGFDERKVEYTQVMNQTLLEKFISIHQFELVSVFSQELSEMFFEANLDKHLILFAPLSDASTADTIDVLRRIAPAFRGQMLFITVDSAADQFKGIIDFFGITSDEIPCLRGVILQEDVARFKQEKTDFSEDVLRTFAEDFLAGNLNPDLKSQDVPKDWDNQPVKVITSANFNQVITERKFAKALVEFYAPWCGHCKALAPIWDQLGDHFKDDDAVIIAKMDSTKNDLLDISITSFPTIKYFPYNSNQIIDYKGNRDLESFIEYINNDGSQSETLSSTESGDEETVFEHPHEDL